MFEKNYKNAMKGVKPAQEALDKTIAAMEKENSKNKNRSVARIIGICAVCFMIVATSVLTAFKISEELSDTHIFNDRVPSYGVVHVNNYKELIKEIKALRKEEVNSTLGGEMMEWEEEIAEDEAVDDNDNRGEPPTAYAPSVDGDKDTPEYSDTNNQVTGVQEADVIKTDGKYIYYLSKNERIVYISSAKDGHTEQKSSINLTSKNYVIEMLLNGDTLVIIYTEYEDSHSITYCDYYDINDRTAPKLIRTMKQDGSYVNSRMIGDSVYIITRHGLWHVRYDDISEETVIPRLNEELIAPECIILPEDHTNLVFTIVTAYDIGNSNKTFDSSICMLGASDIIYSGKENLYLTQSVYFYPKDNEDDYVNTPYVTNKTQLYRIKLGEDKIEETGYGVVDGNVKDQFSIDEKDGKIRIATRIQEAVINVNERYGVYSMHTEQYNKVFCLGEDMRVIGESKKLGIDEQIKSVRYIGDIAYVVTFRQTDPLYAVDLSDPSSPKTLSELKITGFSAYMQQFDEDLLLGIGYEASESGVTNGLKLTMFDITDNTDIYAASNYVLSWDNGYYDSEAIYNHKAVLIDSKKNIIAIPLNCSEYYFNEEYGEFRYFSCFVFFEYVDGEIKEKGRMNFEGEKFSETSRALYIGDYGYVVNDNGIIAVSLKDMKIVSTLEFKR